MILTSEYNIGDKVIIDKEGLDAITGYIVTIRWSRDCNPAYEVSWLHNGVAEFTYFDEWRLLNARSRND